MFKEQKHNTISFRICEGLDCTKVASEELKIPLGDYGERIFYFCKKCVQKLIGDV